jgi:hypothetical protein
MGDLGDMVKRQSKLWIHTMGSAVHEAQDQAAQMGTDALTSSQTAEYTRDMLDSLKKIAVQQHQAMLARLLDLALLEAGRIAGMKTG